MLGVRDMERGRKKERVNEDRIGKFKFYFLIFKDGCFFFIIGEWIMFLWSFWKERERLGCFLGFWDFG